MSRQINNKRSWCIVMESIMCFLGFLFCLVCIAVIAVDSYQIIDLHANGYTTEATVTEKLRKSKARVQFTDYSGNSQTSIISRIRISCDNNAPVERYTIRYSPKYPGKAVVCEWPNMLVSWLVKIISLPILLLTSFALFPYSCFKKKDVSNKSE